MINPLIIISITVAYVITLFLIAYAVERFFKKGRDLTNSAVIYALALGIYCTAWTFYGNIGLVVTNSYLFIAVYLGPVLTFIFWRGVLGRMIRIREEYGITSIADFISTRYGKSTVVAAIVTMMAAIGIIPYLSLQLKAIFTSYAVITRGDAVGGGDGFMDLAVLAVIIIFTIVFGLRKLEQSERHPGMVMAIAIQSVVKLVAFLAVGFFATYSLFHGFSDIFNQVSENFSIAKAQTAGNPSYSLFLAYLILSMSAIIFLPRQFHMAVVENTDKKHIHFATWFLALYFILITIFVYPIAMGGMLNGFDPKLAENFILLLPLHFGQSWLAILVFLGGFSAAISMIMISALTITIMISNHLALPFFEKVRLFNFFRRHLLFLRWIIIAAIMAVAYVFEEKIGSSYVLVKMGMISFAAVLQFAPAVIGALFWEKGSRVGAVLGLLSGFFIWSYTSLIPAFARSGWMNESLLTHGPFHIGFLRPEHLFGITNMDPLALTVMLSLVFNVGFYILGSFLFEQDEKEKQLATSFSNSNQMYVFSGKAFDQDAYIDLDDKIDILRSIFGKYMNQIGLEKAVLSCLNRAGLQGKSKISLSELTKLNDSAEKMLSGYLGSASANIAMSENSLFTKEETRSLSEIYSKMASDMKLDPVELAERIDYFTEKERLLEKQGQDLEEMVKKRTHELEEKNAELEKFYDMTVGRELQMAEMKEKIKEMEKKIS